MSRRIAVLCVALALSSPASAHHSYVSKYDGGKIIRLSGTVSDVSYKNPHIFFVLTTSSGSWTIETESISVARGAGLTEDVLKDGAAAAVMGWPARSGGGLGLKSITIGGRTLTLRGTAR
ncbi:MAG: DUF6152 family protein [Hyphomicrobium sp.]